VEIDSLKKQVKKYKDLAGEIESQSNQKQQQRKSLLSEKDLQVKDMMISSLQT